MTDRVALKLDRNRELVLVTVAWMAVAASFAFGQGNAVPKTQAPAGQGVTSIPQWQTEAGGKMTFEVASIRPSKPDTFTPPNFALSPDDSYISTGGIFTADFPRSHLHRVRLQAQSRPGKADAGLFAEVGHCGSLRDSRAI
jgi:hypothetical protein